MVWPSSADRVCCVLYDISSLPHLGQRRSTWTTEEERNAALACSTLQAWTQACPCTVHIWVYYSVENRHKSTSGPSPSELSLVASLLEAKYL